MRKTAPTKKTKVEKVMHEFKVGTPKSSSGTNVMNLKQAFLIALAEARAAKRK
jgi:hypothetical protein